MSQRTFNLLQGDLRSHGRAVLRKGLFGWRRVGPDDCIVLEPVFSKTAVEAAKQDQSLVHEFAEPTQEAAA